MGFGLLNVNMINKMKKRITLLVVSIIISLDVYSICYNSNGIQNCKETDSINKQKCIQKVSVFTEKYKQKDCHDCLVSAYTSWSWVFKNCPQQSINTYKYAPRFLKAKIKEDQENKSSYIDTLLMVFDQRIECFGQKGFVLGLKGYELLRFDKSKVEEAYSFFGTVNRIRSK